MQIRSLFLILLAIAALATPSAQAAGGTTLEGKTIAWDDVLFSLSDSGIPISWKVAPMPVNCRKAVLDARRVTIRDFDTASPTAFTDTTTFKERYGRYRVRTVFELDGEHADGFWIGSFNRISTVMRKGRTIDTCKDGGEWHTFHD
jgi:hypothetical protein